MNDEDPVVIEREYKKYMKGESHGFNLYAMQCKGLLSVLANYSLSLQLEM